MNNSIKNTLRSGLLLLPLLTGLQASSCGICKFYAENNLSCDDWYCVGFEYYYADHTSTQPWGSGWTWVRRVFGSSYDTMHHEGFISGLYVWTDWSHIPFPLPPNSSMLGFPYLNFGDDEGDLSGKLTRDPVNVESGCVVDECSDITLTHPALPLKWTRFYNGAWATNATDIGKGWRHSYDWRLLFFSVERCQIITPDGVTYQFAPTLEENTWETVYDVKWTLIKEYDGSTDEFVLSISPVKKLRFSANGNLLSYDNGQGGHLEFSYSASGILEHIVFSCNHQLTIEHSAGRITAVRTPISSHWVEYDYDECGNLRAASIHYSGKTRTTYYEYGPIGLISMTSANGETAAYTYATTPGLVEYTKCTNSVFGAGWYEHSLEYCTNRICITAQWEGDDITGDYVPYTNIVKQSHTHVRYQASQDSTIEEDIAYSQGIVTDKWFGTNLLFHTEYLTDGKWPQRSRKETTWRTTEIGLAEPMAIRTWTYDDNYHPISESYSFCANGGLAGQSTISWFWDETLGVCTARIDANGIFSYDYDPDGRLLFRTDAGNTYGRIYDGLHMKYEYNATTGEPTRSFTHSDAIDNWLGYSAYANGTTNHYVFITDVFGTVIAVVDSNGNIAERYAYDAYGRVVAVYDSEGNIHQRTQIGNSLLWRGGEYDWNTGLYLFRSRWYDPVTGRWISKDPIGSAGGHNLYEYCGNDPVNCIDPFGTEAIVLSGRSSLGTIRGYLQKSPGRSTMNQMSMYLQPEAYLIAEYAYGINGGFKFHSGMGEMDFATQNGINDWHVPRRGVMSPSAFGNYAAGYYAGYSQLPGMYLGVRAGGLAYSVTAAATAAAINAVNALGIPSALGWPKVPSGNPERWDDSQSVPDIDNGFADGKRDREMGK